MFHQLRVVIIELLVNLVDLEELLINYREIFEKSFQKYLLPIGAKQDIIEVGEREDRYKGWWKITLTIPINVTDGSDFPSKVPVVLYISPTYPFSDYAVFTEHEAINGYSHQDAETGKLCLWSDYRLGYSENRIWHIVQSTRRWLNSAASGTLATPSDEYELPDFSRHLFSASPKIYFDEDLTSFPAWNPYLKKYGTCSLGSIDLDNRNLFVIDFHDSEKRSIKIYNWGSFFDNPISSVDGIWILFDKEPVICRKRPCQTWREFSEVLKIQGISLKDIFIQHSKEIRPFDFDGKSYLLILIGFPIPKYNNGDVVEIHWQPILLDDWKTVLRTTSISGFRVGKAPPAMIWSKGYNPTMLKNNSSLFWIKSNNVNQSRYFGRGCLSSSLCQRSISLFGVGAVGSYFGNCLVREGVTNLKLFDKDAIEAGNLGRHIAGIDDIGQNKVETVTKLLMKSSPHLYVDSYKVNLPVSTDSKEYKAMLASDIWINCTASECIDNWLSILAFENNKILVNIYITYEARYLCMYGNGNKVPAHLIHDALIRMGEQSECEIPQEFFKAPAEKDLLREGIGCWHPTFPARLHEILLLVSFAVDRLNARLNCTSENGWAVVAGMDGDNAFGNKPSLKCYFEGDIIL